MCDFDSLGFVSIFRHRAVDGVVVENIASQRSHVTADIAVSEAQ